jgi:hypothetical protein
MTDDPGDEACPFCWYTREVELASADYHRAVKARVQPPPLYPPWLTYAINRVAPWWAVPEFEHEGHLKAASDNPEMAEAFASAAEFIACQLDPSRVPTRPLTIQWLGRREP